MKIKHSISKLKILQFVLLLFFAQFLSSQTIKGTVLEENNKIALPGVNVLVQGTTIGTQSDFDGNFEIKADIGDVLIFSYLGMKTKKTTIDSSRLVQIEMEEDAGLLDEVVVVGYGSQKKSDISGSITSIKAEELSVLPTQRADQALQGRAAGVMVLNTDGSPGGNTRIRIRGMNSILGGNEALIVIDGVQGGSINNLNPSDIASMEVLKDASATAIYGSKGANGVILITTKLGGSKKPSISYEYSFGLQELRKKLDLLNATEYMQNINAYDALGNENGPAVLTFSPEEIQEFNGNPGTDWQDEIFQVAQMENHQVSVSGGSDNASYYFSTGYIKQDGILVNSSFERLNLRGNLNVDINKSIKAGFNLSYIESKGNVNPSGSEAFFLANPILLATQWPANIPVYDAEGNYNQLPYNFGPQGTWNPVAGAKETKTNNEAFDNFANLFVEAKLFSGLKLKVSGGRNVVDENRRLYYNGLTLEGIPVGGKPGSGSVRDSRYEFWQNTNLLTYDKEISNHKFTITAGAEQQVSKSTFNSVQASQFTSDLTGLDDLASAAVTINGSGQTKRVLNSYFGRLDYIFGDRYILTATYRADGSSVFGENNKWGYFPSVAGAWRVSNENFLRESKWLSNLKIRASWGITGNQAISPYSSLAAVVSNPGRFNYPLDGTDTDHLGLGITKAANPDLRWESTTQRNFGLDVGLFSGRLSATIDAYFKSTDDLLLNRVLPGYTGLTSITDNVGSTENNGIEVALSGDPIVGDFNWNTGFNISWNKNKVVDLGTDDEMLKFASSTGGYGLGDMTYLEEGQPFGNWYGFGFEGLWSENERQQAAEFGQLPGDQKFTDVNGDKSIDSEDRMIIGNALPDFFYGWNNTFRYKNVDLSFLIQGSYGNDVFNSGRIKLESSNGTGQALLDRWTPTNQDSNIPAFTDIRTRLDAALENRVDLGSSSNATGRFVEDGSYIRLKNVSIGYSFSEDVISKLQLSSLRAYISGTNLITITDYTGYDPEVSSFNDNDASVGIDLGNYPSARTFNIGLKLSF